MHKLICMVAGMFFASAALAADVVDRTSCADIKSRIDELSAAGELSEADAGTLAELQANYRRDCSIRAGARATRTIAAKRGVTALSAAASVKQDKIDKADKVDTIPVADSCDNPDSHGCCPGEEFMNMGDFGQYCCTADACFPPMDVKPAVPEKTAEEIAAEEDANLAKGLCKDGSKPNKYGCCGNEKFKDMGNLVFACCPEDGGDCYPPIGQEVKQ